MRITLVLAAALLSTLPGCSLPRRPLIATRYYSIDVPPPAPPAPSGAPAQAILAVRLLDSPSRYRDRIFFRSGANAVGYHERERWVEPPAEMMTAVLRRTLEASGVARVVADERLLRRPDLILDGRLERFDAVQADSHWAADCELRLVLRRADDNTVLLATCLAASHPAKGKTVPSFVEAMNAAVAEVAVKAAEAVGKGIAGSPPPKKP